ncbi:mucin-2-like isoform X2 [Haliotis rufescens]|uniref:mucin-2-like isoform X2 n=1 Tax=Haliotis rufescens TaxID=6454 RepID=UPI00201E7F45|nr:mucin-2-like isoform X2 [Haliotis rufescens]
MMLRICIAVFYLCTVCNGTPVDKASYLWQAHNGGGYDTLSNQVINLPSGPNLGYEANSNSQVNMILNLADNTDNVVNSEGMTNAGNSYNVLSLLGGGNQDGEVQSLDTVVSSGQTQLTDIRTTQTAQIVLTTRLETSSNKEYRTESTKVPDMSPQNTTTKLTEAGKAELLPSTTFNVTASTTSLPRGRFGSASLSRVNATSLNNTTKADTPHALVRLLPNTTTSGKLISDSGIVSTHVPSDTTISSAKGSATATPKITAGESPIFKAASKPWSGQTNTTAAKQKHTSATIVTTKSSSIWRTPTLSPIKQNTSTKYTITTAITPIAVHTSSIITTTHTTTATPYITTHLVNSFTNILLTSSPPPTMFDKHIINNNHPRTFDTTSTASPLNTTIQSRSFVTTYSPTNPVSTEASLNTILSGSTFSKTTQSKTITSSTTSTSTTTTLSPATIHLPTIISTITTASSPTTIPKTQTTNTTPFTATFTPSTTIIPQSTTHLPTIISTITTASSPTTIPKTQTYNTTPFTAKFTPSTTIIPQSTTHLPTIISTITTASSPTTIPKTQTSNTTQFTAKFTPSATIIPQSTTHLPTIISTITTASSPTTIPKTQTTNTTPFTATFTPSTTIIPQSTTHLPTIISTITTASSPTTIPKTQTTNTTPFTATFTPSTTIIPQSTTHLPTVISTITTASSPTTIPKTQTSNTTPFTAKFTPSTTIIPQSTTHLPTVISTITTASSPTTIPKTQTSNTTQFTATFTPSTTIIPQSTTHLTTIISTITTASSPKTIPKTQTSNTTQFTATFTPSTTIIPQSTTHLPTIISTITTALSPTTIPKSQTTTTPFTTSTSLPATAIPKTHSITSATPFTVTQSNTIRSPPTTTITSSTTTISPSTTKLPTTPSATRETPSTSTITSSTITYSTTLSTTTYNPITTVHSTVALSTSRSTPSLSTTPSTTVTARPTPLVRTSPKMPMKSKPQAPSNTPTKMDTTTDDLISTTSHETIEEKLLNISGTSFPYENNCRAYWQCENEKPVMKCCPNKATFTWNHGCIPNPSCNPECDPGYDISSMCDDRLKVDGNFHYYYRMVHKLAIIRPCPDGTIFREELCRCDYPPTGFQDHPACHPKFEMTFDGDSPFEDISSSGNDFEMFHIQPTAYGTGQFYDKSMMIIKRLNGTTMGYKFAVHLKFFAREGSDRMVLLSDCLHGNDVESASVDIRLHTSDGTVVFRVHTYSSPLWHVQIPYKRNEWNMVSLIYEGTKVKASVNKSQKTNPVFFGSLRRKQAGLVIGKCSDSDGFTGEIDSVFPLGLTATLPHNGLWPFKSPMIMHGLGSWSN